MKNFEIMYHFHPLENYTIIYLTSHPNYYCYFHFIIVRINLFHTHFMIFYFMEGKSLYLKIYRK